MTYKQIRKLAGYLLRAHDALRVGQTNLDLARNSVYNALVFIQPLVQDAYKREIERREEQRFLEEEETES